MIRTLILFSMLTLGYISQAIAEEPKFTVKSAEEQIDGSVLLTDPDLEWNGEFYYIHPDIDSWTGACRLYGRRGKADLKLWEYGSPSVKLTAQGKVLELTDTGAIVEVVCF